MNTGGHAFGSVSGCKAGAHRETTTNSLGDGHDVGLDARPFMSEEFAGTANARLHFVEDQQKTLVIADLAQQTHELFREATQTALALHRLEQNCCGLTGDRSTQCCFISEWHLIEAVDLRAETFEILGLTTCGNRSQCTAVECAFKSDDAEALRIAVYIMIAARGLDRAFKSLGTGIGKEHFIRKCRFNQTSAQLLLSRNLIEIGQVPQLVGLIFERIDQMRMGMAQ